MNELITLRPNPPVGAKQLYDGANVLGLCAGQLFEHRGKRFRVDCIHPDGAVELMDLRSHGRLQAEDPETGARVAPSVNWMRDQYAAGLLWPIGETSTDVRQANFALLDPDGAVAVDVKSRWRFRLCWRALADNVKLSDRAVEAWLDANFGSERCDLDFPRPSAPSMRRWMSKISKGETKVSTLVSQCGRLRNQSQLDPKVNMLVTQAVTLYWARASWKHMDARVWLDAEIKKLNKESGAKHVTPSAETIRRRIQRARCFDTLKSKLGEEYALKTIRSSGEPMLVDQYLQVALMDATTLEQAIVFDKDWFLPATKVKITLLMDVYSTAILGFALYAGPNRSETSAEAILSAILPSPVDPEMLKRFPDLANIFGRPAAIMPDNEKALIGPAMAPGLNELGITLLLPAVECPTAKSELERFIRTLKSSLQGLPGTILDPIRARELGYDAIGKACLTLCQLRDLVWQAVNEHNASPSAALGGRSPLQIVQDSTERRATPAFTDIREVRSALSRGYEVTLTTNGVELDSLRYRDRRKVQQLIENNLGFQKLRKPSRHDNVSIRCRARRHDGDISYIEVFDQLERSWVMLPCTQPTYTDRLSAWEHKEFKEQAKRRNERFVNEDDRLFSRRRTLEMIDEFAPQVAFQQRRAMAALYQSDQLRRQLGDVLDATPKLPTGLPIAPQRVVDTHRLDSGLPAAMPQAARRDRQNEQAPPRSRAHYSASVSGDAESYDWEALDEFDPQTGEFLSESDVETDTTDTFDEGDA